MSSRYEVVIDEAVLAQFEALADVRIGAPGFAWTPEKDTLLLRYWPTKRKAGVAKLLGCNESTARKRYRELTAEVTE
jgi:hypothetical protein